MKNTFEKYQAYVKILEEELINSLKIELLYLFFTRFGAGKWHACKHTRQICTTRWKHGY